MSPVLEVVKPQLPPVKMSDSQSSQFSKTFQQFNISNSVLVWKMSWRTNSMFIPHLDYKRCDGSCFCSCENQDHDCHVGIPWYRVRKIAWLDENGRRHVVERMCISCNHKWIKHHVINQYKRMEERNVWPEDVWETWKAVSANPWDPEYLWFRLGNLPQ